MESRDRLIRIAVAVASLAALSILVAAQYHRSRTRRRHRRGKQLECPPTSCYLHADPSGKPQHSFKRVLADNSFSQFKHLNLQQHGTILPEKSANSHPYEQEIRNLMENPGVGSGFESLAAGADARTADSYIWINTETVLKELAYTLSQERVFAVDTEQHSLRSFLGFTALIQISTRKEDYLVDTIALHDAMGVLAPVFADSSILKVFHGADNDVVWLQRDFHIYAVNLFDTAKACEVLSKPQKSLAYLLDSYCGVATNKSLQREDWRLRPLSPEMLEYARTDAHYLLYIAGCLIDELKQQDNGMPLHLDDSSCPSDKSNFLLEATRRSNMICLQLYNKEIEEFPGESAASSIVSRLTNGQGGSSMSSEAQELVRRVCTWRDLMARVHDESLKYVLSDQAIVALADKVPATPEEVYETIAQADLNLDLVNFNPTSPSPSPVVSCHLDGLFSLFQDKESNFDEFFPQLLKKCLGPNGSCPLTISNYALLLNYDTRLTNRLVPKQNGVRNSKHVARKASRELFVQKFSCKSPVYHNCRIFANDGRLLCYCDRRKLEWYLRRDLAKLVDDNPPAIMLLFEPKGRPEDEDNNFYVQSKKNICVGCGEGSHYLRYRIIPSCYRMHFPEHLKSHRSHDIVLLCVDCHELAHAAAEKYKKQVAAEFCIPLFVRKVVDHKESPVISAPPSSVMSEEAGLSPLQLRTAATALLRHGKKMPAKRCEELTQIVMEYYGGREISEEDLEKALLVGLSPNMRRRLGKKRGLSLKHTPRSILSDQDKVNEAGSFTNESTSEVDTLNGSQSTEAESSSKMEEQDHFTVKDTFISDLSSDIRDDEAFSATAFKNMDSDGYEVPVSDDSYVLSSSHSCESSQLNGTVDFCYPEHSECAPPKDNSKLSLLGHGPHGKQVVEHILKEYGDDGIRQFCQRWRHVFVEAIHPRFLPTGWDVMHSGRRDFGEFSVYNPSKKASAAKS